VVIREAEGPLIFSERFGESGSSTCGGVLAGEDKAFVWEKALPPSSSSSSSPSDRPSVRGVKFHCPDTEWREVVQRTHRRQRRHIFGRGPIPAVQAMAFFR